MGSVFLGSLGLEVESSWSKALLERSLSVTELRMPQTSMSAFMESEVVVSSTELWHWYCSSDWTGKGRVSVT